MPIEKLRPSFTFTEDRLKELQVVVPEAFTDGKINWDVLRESLGEYMEDENKEHFGLSWPGKREARRLAAMPSKGTLMPQPGEGVNEENTKNIFIEGENLEVLKLLKKSYSNKIQIIYIDPPYNTGNDFIYSDHFSDPTQAYLILTGQSDDTGKILTTNPETSGRFHSRWLSMIYPRLLLARELLRDDGFIFVSIDDNEVNTLRLIMNEIFGEENFVEQITWKKSYGGGSKTRYVVSLHEYILCFAKNKESIDRIELPPDPEARKYYTGRDEKYEQRGPFRTQPLATTSMDDRPNLRYPIYWNGEEILPEKQWQWSKERVEAALAENELIITKVDSNKWSVRYKQYLLDEDGKERSAKPFSILDGPYTQEGTAEIKELFGDGKAFSFPKPTKLIQHLLSYSWQNQNAIFLDFFAGSCSTAQAVFNLNKEHDGNRSFIVVQYPEVASNENPQYKTISDIGKERIRRVIAKIKTHSQERFPLLTLDNPGFTCYTLTSSNFNEWVSPDRNDVSQLELRFTQTETPLGADWQPANLLVEILLLQGFPLDSRVHSLPEYKSNQIQEVSTDFCQHCLYICLDKQIKPDTVAAIHLRTEDVFICLDTALSDETKIILADRCNLKVI